MGGGGAGPDRGELDCIFSLTAANQVRENLKKEREKKKFCSAFDFARINYQSKKSHKGVAQKNYQF